MTRIMSAINQLALPTAVYEQEYDMQLPSGSYNTVRISRIQGVRYTTTNDRNNGNFLFVVKSRPNTQSDVTRVQMSVKNNSLISKSLQALNFMRDRQVRSEFINYPLYYNHLGASYTEYTQHADVFEFASKNEGMFSLDIFKRLIGQAFLAVADLHEKNFRHGDVKPENILVYCRGQRIFLKLADLDTVAEVNGDGFLTESDIWPMRNPFIIMTAPETLTNHPNSLNQKAVDCYALGMVIHFLVHTVLQRNLYAVCRAYDELKHPSQEGNYVVPVPCIAMPGSPEEDVYNLIAGLTRTLPHERLDIWAAMQSKFFGKDESERAAFFVGLRVEAMTYNSLLFDNRYLFTPPAMNDPSYLLDNNVKSIIVMSYSLDTEMTECQEQAARPEEFFMALQKFHMIIKNIDNILVNINNFLVSDPSRFQLFAKQIVYLENEIIVERNKLKFMLYVQLPKNLVTVIGQTFEAYDSTLRAQIQASNMFASSLRYKQSAASELTSQLVGKINNASNSSEAFYAVASCLSPLSEMMGNTFKELLRRNLEVRLGKTIEEITVDLGIIMPQDIVAAPAALAAVNL